MVGKLWWTCIRPPLMVWSLWTACINSSWRWSLWTLNSALGLLPCPVCWVLKLLESLDLPGVSFLPCVWVLKLLAAAAWSLPPWIALPLLSAELLVYLPAQRKRVVYLISLGCDPIWEITGRSNDLFTYCFCKDKSTSLRPVEDLQSAIFNSVLSRFYNFYKL